MIKRTLEKKLIDAVRHFPVVTITGPRQSGKTSLLEKMFRSTHKIVSLEDTDIRLRAKEDPRVFLKQYSPPVLIDEIQYLPDLLSYIKTKIDNAKRFLQETNLSVKEIAFKVGFTDPSHFSKIW